MELNVCVPVLNRYDLLDRLIASVSCSTIKANIFIVNNGNKKLSLDGISILNLGMNLGVAKAWNWFIRNVPEIRLICNDDIEFLPDTLEKLVSAYDEDHLIIPNLGQANAFSCFIIPDKVVEIVGLFDETISPNYAYFEDNDYAYRMGLAGITGTPVPDATVNHPVSSTLKAMTKLERDSHDKKFKLAKTNFIKKWGGKPGEEKFLKPYGIN